MIKRNMTAMTTTRSMRLIALSSVAALGLVACGGGAGDGGPSAEPVAKVTAPAGQRWSQVVSATPDGFRMGNPDAPLKLVEYASPTCVHCSDFSKASHSAMESEFIDSGRVSLELRPFMLNSIDVLITSIISCSGPERYFPLLTNVYATRDELIAASEAGDQAAAQAAMQLPEAQRFPALSRAIGLNGYFAARGITEAEINRCLSNPATLNRWAELTQKATTEAEISQTPTFLLNGTRIEVPAGTENWPTVQERLRAAGAR
jgi:Thioredoxin